MSTIEKAFGNRKQSQSEDKKDSRGKTNPQDSVERADHSEAPAVESRPTFESESTFESGPRFESETNFEPEASTSPFVAAQSARPLDKTAVLDIPFDKLSAAGFLSPESPRSTTAEEFRAIKRPLLKNIAGQSAAHIKNANLIMVTSALEGDGKTFSSLNLAMSIAMEQDKTVLFIDADVLKASAGRVLGIPQGTPGLIDILMGKVKDPEDTILRTSMDKLRVMPAGTPHENATELLAGKNMHRLMQDLSTRYTDRVIVFDSPPLLLTTESSVLASFMGQIVFVAAANTTPQHAVREALEDIGKDKMVAVMLNKASRQHLNLLGIGHNYGYGYGYGYGRREDVPLEAAEVPSR